MQVNRRNGPLFRMVTRAIKYYMLGLFGFVMVCLIAAVLGVFYTLEPFLPFLLDWLLRVAALLVCLMATAILVESLRH